MTATIDQPATRKRPRVKLEQHHDRNAFILMLRAKYAISESTIGLEQRKANVNAFMLDACAEEVVRTPTWAVSPGLWNVVLSAVERRCRLIRE